MKRLLDLAKKLREPETGCPWDIKQTFETLADLPLTEARELKEAIEKQDTENMKEELGDVIFNCVMLINLAEEEGLFTLEDVLQGSEDKMIYRHPHVFGDKKATTEEEATLIFNEMKAKEKNRKES